MLLSPLTLPEAALRRRAVHRPCRTAIPRTSPHAGSRPATRVVTGWLVLGLGVLLLVPPARGDATLGATLPFWLVGAPVLNLLFLERRAWIAALRGRFSRRARTRGGVRRP